LRVRLWYLTNGFCDWQVTAIQSYAKNFLGGVLLPLQMRELLISTGLPQGDPEEGDIGPFIQMRRAIEVLQQRNQVAA
jgi:hypothetical protein